MDKSQFTLLRLMGGLTCFAVAMGAARLSDDLPWLGFPLGILALVMPGVSLVLLGCRIWIGVMITGFLLFLALLL